MQVGEIPREVAELAASFDDWEHRRVATPEALLKLLVGPLPDVLIVVSLSLTQGQCRDLADAAVRRSTSLSLGLVVGHSAEQLTSLLARLAPGAGAAPREWGPNLAYMDDTMLTEHLPSALDVKSLSSGPRHTAELFGEPAEVTYLCGHSNSQCQGASGGIAMCTRDAAPATAPGAPQLPCFRGAPCRFSPDDRVRVPSSNLRSRILINLTCFGHYVSGETYAAESSVSAGYWQSRELLAMLTTFGPVYFSETDFLTAYYMLNSGLSVGEVAAAMNAARLSRGDTIAVACVGDPRQAVTPTVRRGELVADGARYILRRPEGVEGSCDLWVELGGEGDAVVSVEEGAVLAGLLMSDGRLFVSLDAETQDVAVRRVPLREARGYLDFSRLSPAIQALEMFHQGAVDHVQGKEALIASVGPDLSQAISHRRLLLETVRRSRPNLVWPGQVFDAPALLMYRDSVFEILEALTGAMSRVYELLLPLRAGVFMLVSDYLARTSVAVAAERCRYCGSSVAESTLEGWGGVVRFNGECDLCGTTYQDGGSAKWIDAPAEACGGTEVRVRMEVHNPFPFPVPAGGAAAFQSFVGAHSTSVRFDPIELDANGRGVLEAMLTIPDAASLGMQRIIAAAIVGGQFSHCRRDVHLVAGRSPRSLPVLTAGIPVGEG